jgi:uncharacterized protein HemY
MKIEIDLNDILGDEDGVETLQESVRRQVITTLTEQVKSGLKRQIEEETTKVINETLRAALKDRMPGLVDEVMMAEYTPVSRYGEKSAPTTFKSELVKAISGEFVYRKTQYSSDQNAFTKAVEAVIAENMKAFKADFDKQVNAQFTAEAMAYAATKLRERLGVK